MTISSEHAVEVSAWQGLGGAALLLAGGAAGLVKARNLRRRFKAGEPEPENPFLTNYDVPSSWFFYFAGALTLVVIAVLIVIDQVRRLAV